MLYLILILAILLDQVSKYLAIKFLLGKPPIVLIEGFLQLNYLENFGAAFGILQNRQNFFIAITVIVIFGIIYYLKTKMNLSIAARIAFSMIVGGAIGNLIDRIRLGYVIDFIDVKFGSLYDYPVFNIADSFIVIGTVIILYLVLSNKYEIERGI